jgi:dienelactone hydrolase
MLPATQSTLNASTAGVVQAKVSGATSLQSKNAAAAAAKCGSADVTSRIRSTVLATAVGRQAVLSVRVRGEHQETVQPKLVVITCGGAGGGPGKLGCDGPSSVYAKLAAVMPREDVAVLQVVYGKAADVSVAVADVRAAIDWTHAQGWGPIVLCGWSMGSAVVVQSALPYKDLKMQASAEEVKFPQDAPRRPLISALITLAGQSAGIDKLATFTPGVQSFLFLHGDDDDCLPTRCLDALYSYAPKGSNKQRVVLPGDHHGVQSAMPILQAYLQKLAAQ